MLRIAVLGAAAGGGLPQWNCGCANCNAARASNRSSTQASIAVSADDANWFLINASPDLRQQIISAPALTPSTGLRRHSPIAGIILTNSEVDAVAGLLSVREGTPFTLYAHTRVLDILKNNSIFDVLSEKNVKRQPIFLNTPFEPRLPDGSASGLSVLPFAVPGKGAWYLEGDAGSERDMPGDTLGLRITDQATGKRMYFVAACAHVDKELRTRLQDGADLLFFDGTVWRDDELVAAGLGAKTGQRMGHIAMSGVDGAIAQLADIDIDTKVFLHINNSNPVWLPDSDERQAAERAGWQIAADGMEFTL